MVACEVFWLIALCLFFCCLCSIGLVFGFKVAIWWICLLVFGIIALCVVIYVVWFALVCFCVCACELLCSVWGGGLLLNWFRFCGFGCVV